MPVVTALRSARRGDMALEVDGVVACRVSLSLVARWRLYEGRELGVEAVGLIQAQAAAEQALRDAHLLLGQRARGCEELRRRLRRKGHPEAALAAAVDSLRGDGLLDDRDFARRFVADKRRLRGWGSERLRRSLEELGVDAGIIAAELSDTSEGAELEQALAVLERAGAPQPPLDAARRRAYAQLLRRGFPSSIAYKAVRQWADSSPAGASN